MLVAGATADQAGGTQTIGTLSGWRAGSGIQLPGPFSVKCAVRWLPIPGVRYLASTVCSFYL